jgi:hypothetical protein
MRTFTAMGLAALVFALAGCGDDAATPPPVDRDAAAPGGSAKGAPSGAASATATAAVAVGEPFALVAEGSLMEIFPLGSAGIVKTDAFYGLLGEGPLEQDPALLKTSFTTPSGGVNVSVAVTPDRFFGAWPRPVFAMLPNSSGFFARVNETWTDTSPLRDGERMLDVTPWGDGRAIAAVRMAEADIRFTLVGSAGGVAVPGPGKPTAEQEGCAVRFEPDGPFAFAGTPSGHLFAAGRECKSGKPLLGFWKPKGAVEATVVPGLDAAATAKAIAATGEDDAVAAFDAAGGAMLAQWDGKAWKVVPAPSGKVSSMFASADGALWILGEKGLFSRKKGGEWGRVVLPGDEFPTSAWAKSADVLWVVTESKQLWRKGTSSAPKLVLPAGSAVRAVLERDKRWLATRACKKLYVMLMTIGPASGKPPATFAGVSNAVKGDAALTGADVSYLIEETAGNFIAGAKVPSFELAEKLVAAFKAKNPAAAPVIYCHEPLVKGALKVE